MNDSMCFCVSEIQYIFLTLGITFSVGSSGLHCGAWLGRADILQTPLDQVFSTLSSNAGNTLQNLQF